MSQCLMFVTVCVSDWDAGMQGGRVGCGSGLADATVAGVAGSQRETERERERERDVEVESRERRLVGVAKGVAKGKLPSTSLGSQRQPTR